MDLTRLALFSALLLGAECLFAQTSTPAGHWQGSIQIPNHELGVTVDLAPDAGKWNGSMTVLNSTAVNVPLEDLDVERNTVRFVARLPEHATFEAKMIGDSMSGTATNDEGSAPLQLKREGAPHVSVPPPSSVLPKEFAGDWEGIVRSSGHRLHLQLASAADGVAHATLISIDQSSTAIPINTVTFSGKRLELESRSVSGTFDGMMTAKGEITGEWSQGQQRVSVHFRRVVPGPTKP